MFGRKYKFSPIIFEIKKIIATFHRLQGEILLPIFVRICLSQCKIVFSFRGASPPDSPPGALPLDPAGAQPLDPNTAKINFELNYRVLNSRSALRRRAILSTCKNDKQGCYGTQLILDEQRAGFCRFVNYISRKV